MSTREWELSSDRVPIDEWANELTAGARLRQFTVETIGKPSLNRAI